MSRRAGHIVFDLDGCLVNTDEMHFTALNQALSLVMVEITKEKHLSTFKGLPTKRKLVMMSEMGWIGFGEHARIEAEKQARTREAIKKTCMPDQTKLALLSTLEIMGYRMAIASNCIRESVDLICETAGLLQHVKFTLSTADVLKGKPDPEMYILAASKFNVTPQNLIVVEDGEAGKESARQAGCRLLEVEGPDEVVISDLVPRILAETADIFNTSKLYWQDATQRGD